MRRAIINFWVDAVIAAAFTVSAFTGILFLLPVSLRSISATGGAAILGMSVSTLRHVHDWSGVVAAVGVIVHAALHLRWYVNMARRIAQGEGQQRRRSATMPAARAAAGSPGRAAPALAAPADSAGAVVAASADDDRRVSRRAFLVGLGTAVGATAFLGAGTLLRSDSTSAAGTQFADAQSGAADPSQAQSGSGWSGGNGWQGGSSAQSGGGSSGSTGGTTQQVVVDDAACVGCGRCLDVCPYGVFAWSGGKAAAQNPDACRLCGHCLQVCPANAITLNG